MATGFDPYYKWLGIPPEEQPPNYYRLLGLRLFESDPEVIEAAVDQRMAFLRTYQSGQYSAHSQKLLNELATAKVCLLSPDKRALYDESLRRSVSVANEVPRYQPQALARTFPAPVQPPEKLQAASFVASTPPVSQDRPYDLEHLGLSANSGGNSNIRTTTAATPVVRDRRHNLLITLLAAAAILLSLITAVAVIAKMQRTDAPVASQDNPPATDQPVAGNGAKSSATVPAAIAIRAPTLLDPAAGTTFPNPDPPGSIELRWQPVPHANRYWVRVEMPNSSKLLVDSRDLHDTSLRVRLQHPVEHGNCRGWRWQVCAMVDDQWTAWSEIRKFDFAEPALKTAEAPMPAKKVESEPHPRTPEMPATPDKASRPDKIATEQKPATPAESASPEKPVEPDQPIVRHPLPADGDRKQAGEAIRARYKKQLAASRSSQERLALAEEMLHAAEASGNDPAAQFALMDLARAQSASAGDTDRAIGIVDQIGQHFQIDPLAMKVDTLTAALQAGTASLDRDHEIGDSVLEVMEQLARVEKYDAAAQLGNLYHDHLRRPFNQALIRQVAAQTKIMREDQAELTKIQASRRILKSKPDDPQANAAVGRFLCLFKGDWDAGLPLLAKGAAGPLAGLARLEQAGADTPAAQLKLADAWWDQAEKEPAGPSRLAHYRRARHWYQSCVDELPETDRSKAQKRIERIERIGQIE
jgi:hypothetical protein